VSLSCGGGERAASPGLLRKDFDQIAFSWSRILGCGQTASMLANGVDTFACVRLDGFDLRHG
jgi:hypothetical protein